MSADKKTAKMAEEILTLYFDILSHGLPQTVAKAGESIGLAPDEVDRLTLSIWSHLGGATVGALKSFTGREIPLPVAPQIQQLAARNNCPPFPNPHKFV